MHLLTIIGLSLFCGSVGLFILMAAAPNLTLAILPKGKTSEYFIQLLILCIPLGLAIMFLSTLVDPTPPYRRSFD